MKYITQRLYLVITVRHSKVKYEGTEIKVHEIHGVDQLGIVKDKRYVAYKEVVNHVTDMEVHDKGQDVEKNDMSQSTILIESIDYEI